MSIQQLFSRAMMAGLVILASSGVCAAVRYHPGHYIYVTPTVKVGNLAAAQSNIIAKINNNCSNANIQGVALVAYWAVLEGPAKDQYKDTFLDTILTEAKRCNKRVIVTIGDRIFGGYANISTEWFPSYLRTDSTLLNGWVEEKDDPSGADWTANLSAAVKVWEQPVMQRLIDLTKHICQRYETDTNIGPYLEMVQFGETALAVPTSMGYSNSKYVTQQKAWMDQVRQACPQTGLRLALNFPGVANSDTVAHIQYAIARDVAVGGPDPELPLPVVINGNTGPRTITANELWRGNSEVTCGNDATRKCWIVGGSTDFRNSGVWVGEQQLFGYLDPNNPNNSYNESPQEILDYQVGTMRARYMIWQYNDDTRYPANQRWSTGILPTIESNAGRVANNSGAYTAPASVPCIYARGCIRN